MLFQGSATRFEQEKYAGWLESHWVVADQSRKAPDKPIGP